MTRLNTEAFLPIYLEPALEEITSGKAWYNFSLISLRTLSDRFNLVTKMPSTTKEESLNVIEYHGYKVVLDILGNTKSVSYNGTDYYMQPGMTVKTFDISLPRVEFPD